MMTTTPTLGELLSDERETIRRLMTELVEVRLAGYETAQKYRDCLYNSDPEGRCAGCPFWQRL